MNRGPQRNRAAKHKRQYRWRHQQRERAILVRFRDYLRRTHPAVPASEVYGTGVLLFEANRIVQWQMSRSLKKLATQWESFLDFPGGATDRTLDNTPQGVTVPVIVGSVSPATPKEP